jgi:Rad3-related DNA helicase
MAESASASYRLKHTTDLRDRIRHLEDFEESLARVERMTSKDWVLERTDGTNQGRKWVFDCVWPAAWVESRLFCGVPKVVVMSGTLNRQIRVRLGVKKENFEFRSWPLQFPASATQIYHVRTVRMNSKIDKAGLDKWVKRTDEVLDAEYEVGHQGLILPVSYERQQHLLDHSRWNHTFVANTKDPESDTAVEVYEKFITGQSEKHKVKGKLGGVALVSPSFGMGWDFKHCAARFSIIAKLPYRNFMSKVVKARLVRDKRYTDTLCVQDLYQAIGRIVRDFDDWGRCYIIDDSIVYLMRVAGDLAPEGYRIVHVNEVPKARVK